MTIIKKGLYCSTSVDHMHFSKALTKWHIRCLFSMTLNSTLPTSHLHSIIKQFHCLEEFQHWNLLTSYTWLTSSSTTVTSTGLPLLTSLESRWVATCVCEILRHMSSISHMHSPQRWQAQLTSSSVQTCSMNVCSLRFSGRFRADRDSGW